MAPGKRARFLHAKSLLPRLRALAAGAAANVASPVERVVPARYLNMQHLAEHKKEALRQAA
jgi:hypothetical protein